MNEQKLTRCPGCATVFRVTAAQLALREGQVRCGHCRAVFDANDHFITLDVVAPEDFGADDELLRGRPTVTLRSADALLPAPADAGGEQRDTVEPSTPDKLPHDSIDKRNDEEASTGEGTASDGTAIEAAPVEESAVEESAVEESADRGAPTEESAVEESAVEESADRGAPTEESAVEESAGRRSATDEPAVEDSTDRRAADIDRSTDAGVDGDQATQAEPTTADTSTTPAADADRDASIEPAAAVSPIEPTAPVAAIEIRDSDRPHRVEWNRRPPVEPSRRRLYVAGIVALALAIVVQLVAEFRDALAARVPATRPLLAGACRVVSCTIEPLKDTAALSIDASDLQADPAHRGLLILSATIRNRAGHP
ncbi:MAG TPA: DUF3426 domain-containing protein, partial [Casimicrobiaceae bacterium]|nr:DUF3426 domain-containing protein [Casimicrobiaceae bacterium]